MNKATAEDGSFPGGGGGSRGMLPWNIFFLIALQIEPFYDNQAII